MRRARSLMMVAAMALAALAVSPGAGAEVLGAHDQPIHDAARLGTGAQVQAILKANPAARDVRTNLGATPLHLAATNRDISALKALIAAGADTNVRDGEGNTPLHLAAFTQHAAHAQALLEAGADPTLKSNAGRDSLSMARKAMAHEVAGIVSLWILKGCKAGKPC